VRVAKSVTGSIGIMPRKFTTVIFDFGGVITSSPFEAFNRFEAERGFPIDTIRRINATNPDDNAWALFERAAIDADAFDRLFADEAAALGHQIRGREIVALLSGDIRMAMVAMLDQLKREGYILGCITNNVPSGKGAGMAGTVEKAEAVAAIMARFDHIIESAKAGIRKPDPRIYQMMCDALAVPPGACIYLDDLGINCKPAATLGMHAIKVVNEAQALEDLRAALYTSSDD
jgi:putative hydrolase of the HAD superfamily